MATRTATASFELNASPKGALLLPNGDEFRLKGVVWGGANTNFKIRDALRTTISEMRDKGQRALKVMIDAKVEEITASGEPIKAMQSCGEDFYRICFETLTRAFLCFTPSLGLQEIRCVYAN